jgi:predicted AlkP superfamily pyrophosphatase or phosphodiesterase
VLFWQNSMFINADTVVTPRPLHLDHEFIQWCYSKPAGYYEQLAGKLGGFKLQHYWGPLAGLGSSRWIAQAAKLTWRDQRPDLMLVYLPHLDYASQKFGPEVPQQLREIDAIVGELLAGLADANVIICSEYSLSPVTGALFPNRQLRAAGLLRVRNIAGKEYLDYELSDAFAMVDHQVAHIFCKPHAIAAARQALAADGVEFTSIAHPRAGELIAIAPADKWFAYYWWDDWNQAPSFAHSVDIHRKPGYDPCELWFDWPHTLRHFWRFPPATGIRPELVKGSHGRVDHDPAGWATLIVDAGLAPRLAATPHVEATAVAPLVQSVLL